VTVLESKVYIAVIIIRTGMYLSKNSTDKKLTIMVPKIAPMAVVIIASRQYLGLKSLLR
jgi:hypothetical protein